MGAKRGWLGLASVLALAGAVVEAAEPLVYPMLFPVAGRHRFGQDFGDPRAGRRRHAGTDILADKMTPVVAVADGTVWWAHDVRGGDCCDLALRHRDGWVTVYVHLNNDTLGTDDGEGFGIAPGITEGTPVTAGQVIGWVGDSGNAEAKAPHLHFELRRPNGQAINPFPSLRAALGLPVPALTRPPDLLAASRAAAEPLKARPVKGFIPVPGGVCRAPGASQNSAAAPPPAAAPRPGT